MAKLKSMKKWISMALAMIMVVAMFTGCASPEKIETKETKETTEATETPNTSVSEEAVAVSYTHLYYHDGGTGM